VNFFLAIFGIGVSEKGDANHIIGFYGGKNEPVWPYLDKVGCLIYPMTIS